jgi:ABC-type branched-subunit amino acid transport system ATPase component
MRCLLLKPSVLLLDEPTAGLPGEVTQRVMDAVADLAARGTTVVIIEHDLDVIWSLCSQVTFMAEGRVALRGEPAVIREHATVVESYLGQGHV